VAQVGGACSFGPDPCHPANLFGDDILSLDNESLNETQLVRERLVRLYNKKGAAGLTEFTRCKLRGPNPVDVSEYEDILLRLGNSSEIPSLLDFNQLLQENISSRTAIFRAALVNEGEELWRGSSLSRSKAQNLVSMGGFSELHSLVLETCPEESVSGFNCRSFEYLQTFVSAPGEFSVRASEMASQVLAYDPNQLTDLVKSDPDFKFALVTVLRYYCQPGYRSSEPCKQLRYGICDGALEANSTHLMWLANHLLAPPCESACPSQRLKQHQLETKQETPEKWDIHGNS